MKLFSKEEYIFYIYMHLWLKSMASEQNIQALVSTFQNFIEFACLMVEYNTIFLTMNISWTSNPNTCSITLSTMPAIYIFLMSSFSFCQTNFTHTKELFKQDSTYSIKLILLCFTLYLACCRIGRGRKYLKNPRPPLSD